MSAPYENHGDSYSPPMDQQHHLFRQSRFPAVPRTTSHIADQIERGGEKIEDTLIRLNCPYQTLFFIGFLNVISAAFVAVSVSIYHFEISNLFLSLCLLFFGWSSVLLDVPGSPRWAGNHRKAIRKFARFLTRLTGKSIWLLFLGCMVTSCLWPRSGNRSSGFLLFLTIFSSFAIILISMIGLFIGLRKSFRLDKVRKTVEANYQGNWGDVYRKYAVNDPSHGMEFEEFGRLAMDFSQGEMNFDLADLNLIFNALDEHQKSAIDEMEFAYWICSGTREGPDIYGGCGGKMTYL